MNEKLKTVLRNWLPPILAQRLARARQAAPSGLQHVPAGWDEANYPGWSAQSVLDHYRREWPKMAANAGTTAPLGRMLNTDSVDGNLLAVSVAYALALAAHGKDRLVMLDWGGGLGYYRLVADAALPGVAVDYSCKDVPLLAEAGQLLHPDARFYSDDAFLCRQYDLVFASGALQFCRDWQAEVSKLAQCSSNYLFVTRLPVHENGPAYVFSQSAYGSKWLAWSLNQAKFLADVESYGFSMVREFLIGEQPSQIEDAPSPAYQRGFLFRKNG